MKIKIFTNKKSFKKGGLITNPNLFWAILLGILFLLIICSFVFGFYLFNKINQETYTENDVVNNNSNTKNEGRIDKVLEYFNNREKKSLDILNSPSPIVDPSL